MQWPTSWEWEKAGKPSRTGRDQTRNGDRQFNQCVVLHTSENSLMRSSAAAVAKWQNTQEGMLSGGTKRYSGYHFLVDRNGILAQCNPDDTKAYHAGKSIALGDVEGRGSNDQIGVAMVARAHKMPYTDQNSETQALDYLLNGVAQLVVLLEERYGIPPQRITREDYLKGRRGWLGHMDVARPLGRKSDPGEHFPWELLTDKVRKLTAPVVHSAGEHPPPVHIPFIQELEKVVKDGGGNARSLNYTLRFYREVAHELSIDGSKPEEVARKLMEKINGKV